MNNKRVCAGCEFCNAAAFCSTCSHKDAYFMGITDAMMFQDSGPLCPFNLPHYREQKLNNTVEFISELKEKCNKLGIKGAVVGISGGKDSTIVAKLMVEVLGKENVMGVLMPNGVQKDISDSIRVVTLLDIPNITVNIGDSFNGLYKEINEGLSKYSKSVSEPSRINIAPRIRMTTLYGVAQSMGNGWRVIGTTNKSEDYIGWLTKWGDGGVDFEPIIDLTVTEVKKLGIALGLPYDLVYKVPIDGLAEGSDEDRIGFTYDELDKYIVEGTSGNKDIDVKIKKMHEYSEHKRKLVPSFKIII